jgi:hypothetical protein
MNNNVTTLKEIFMKTENEIASAILEAAHLLGNGDASTPMGAIEALGKVHREGMAEIADALREIASAINTMQGEARENHYE